MARRTTIYRYLTGPDDDAFCRLVTEALAQGWVLYGAPSLAHDAQNGRVVCGQAITKEVDEAYDPARPLGSY
jgi:hypothetical protein